MRKRSDGQQRELWLTEERPPRHMVRVALTSGACKKGGRPEWRSHVPHPKGEGAARSAGSRGPCTKRRLERAGGRGRRSTRRSEVSRVDHVTVDNAVLDAPKRSFHAPWSVLGRPKLDPRRQPRSTWYQAHPLSSRQRVPRSPSKGGGEVGSRGTVMRLTARRADGWRNGARLGSARLRSCATGPLKGALSVKSRR